MSLDYMSASVPRASDFTADEFFAFCQAINWPISFHRKLWEWAFIEHHLQKRGMLASGKRGLVFGVGTEPLPAYFASLGCRIVATDGPEDVVTPEWAATGQFSDDKDKLFYSNIVDRRTFDSAVRFETCDMRAISGHLRDFDFCWSSCCFEHLGSLDAGADFVLNSLRTLRPGGVAVHTTEFNLSSNEEMLSDGPTVIYRHKDLQRIIKRAVAVGSSVEQLNIVPGATAIDQHVDLPPYNVGPHLKLRLAEYSATSVGLVLTSSH